MLSIGQQNIYERPPEFILKHGIKRMTQMRNTAYHQEKKIQADSSQMFEFDKNGLEVFSTSYFNNERYYWNESTFDDENRLLKNIRYNKEGVQTVSEYNYLSNGDYIIRFHNTENPANIRFYKYFFDVNGNEVRREEWAKDSVIINWDVKTYNAHNRILSRIHQTRLEDTVVGSWYFYKHDTVLKRKDFYSRGELSMRTKYAYFPDGKEKVTHFGKQSSWYSFYDDQGRLIKQMIAQHDRKDTVYNIYTYNEKGLIYSVRNERKDIQQRREVYTYQDGKEQSKTIYTRANTFNARLETEYLGDTAMIVYQTPYWENKANHAHYKRIDRYGNVIEEFQGEIKGKKQPLKKWSKDFKPIGHHYTYTKTGKVLCEYRRYSGWNAESAMCPTYEEEMIHDGLKRIGKRRKHSSCDTIKTKKYNGGKHFFVSINCCPNLTRHIYMNKDGIVDSILDVNKAGSILNRMVKENGASVSYSLIKRFEYNDMDSIRKIFKCSMTRTYALFENMVEEFFWKNGRKVKVEKFMNNWAA